MAVFFHPQRDPFGAGFLYLTLREGRIFSDFFSSNACDYFLAFLARVAMPRS